MPYDFTTIYDRHGKDALAVEGLGKPGFAPPAPKNGFSAIPMWVADMNFATVPTIPGRYHCARVPPVVRLFPDAGRLL